MVLMEKLSVSWFDVLIYSGIAIATWLLHFLFIRPYMHPLRKMPGTKYYPLIGNMSELMKGESMECSLKYIEKYGPILRYYFLFGMERVMVADPQIMKYILVSNCKNYIKPASRVRTIKAVMGNGLVFSEGQTHTMHKKLMSPSFNHTSIKKMIPTFELCFRKLATTWLKQVKVGESTADVNVHSDITRTTLDIIGKTAFNYEFNCLENPDLPVSTAFQRILQGASLSWRTALPFYTSLPFPDVKRLKKELGLMNEAVYSIIKAKRKVIESGKDFSEICNDVLGMIMLAQDETTGEGMNDQELRDQVMTLMLAGHETTAVALSWCLLTLSQYPDVQDKARKEILKTFPANDEQLTWEKLEQLDYCGCIIKEVLRLYPAVPLTLRQAINDDILGGYDIPAGTILLLCVGPMMRQESLFVNANTFNPDRYQDEDAKQKMYNFLPFLIGPRMCLGYKFALMEMRVALVVLLRHLEFKLIPGTQYKRKSFLTMRPHPSLRLTVSPVKE